MPYFTVSGKQTKCFLFTLNYTLEYKSLKYELSNEISQNDQGMSQLSSLEAPRPHLQTLHPRQKKKKKKKTELHVTPKLLKLAREWRLAHRITEQNQKKKNNIYIYINDR